MAVRCLFTRHRMPPDRMLSDVSSSRGALRRCSLGTASTFLISNQCMAGTAVCRRFLSRGLVASLRNIAVSKSTEAAIVSCTAFKSLAYPEGRRHRPTTAVNALDVQRSHHLTAEPVDGVIPTAVTPIDEDHGLIQASDVRNPLPAHHGRQHSCWDAKRDRSSPDRRTGMEQKHLHLFTVYNASSVKAEPSCLAL